MTNYLRPDEQVRESEIKKSQGRTNEVRSAFETASSFGTGAIGAKAASKIIPLLSKYIPEDLAFKGINKLIPSLGNFLKKGTKEGLSLKSGLEFLREEFTNEKKEKTQPNQKSIIEQYSPELHQFLDQQIKSGRSPLEAGALAQNTKQFEKIIKKISEDHKAPWSSILESIFGTGQQAPIQSQQQQPPNDQMGQQGQQPQQSQSGQGQQALMAAIQKLQQIRGK